MFGLLHALSLRVGFLNVAASPPAPADSLLCEHSALGFKRSAAAFSAAVLGYQPRGTLDAPCISRARAASTQSPCGQRYFSTTPHAIRSPEFPAGSVL